MKVEDLLLIPPSELSTLSDSALADRLSPLIPLARAPYIGPRTGTIMVGNKKVSKRSFQSREKMMDALLKTHGITLPS